MDLPNDDLFDEKIKRLLTETVESEGFHDYEVEKDDGSIKGDGYTGIIKTVSISSKHTDKVLNLVVKGISKNDAFRSHIEVSEIFGREIHMYEKVLTAFRKFETEKGLPVSNFTPKFYSSLFEEKSEAIILENLKDSGYELYERRIPMNEDHVHLVLTEYGRLHALSFALKDQNPDRFNSVTGFLRVDHFARFLLTTNFIQNFIQRCTIAQDALDENEDSVALKVYKRFIDTIPSFFEDLFKLDEEYSVALHGDCWTNNMMFKYEDEANPAKPTQVRFFDFQLSRLGSPVLDLSYFFYACSAKEIINDLDYYMEVYYKSFSNYMRQLGSDPEKHFPYSVLRQHWKKYSRFGLVLACLIIHLMLTEKEEAVDLDDVSETERNVKSAFVYKISKVAQYNERIKPIILHFVENNFI